MNYKEKLNKIKTFVFDVDGVFTDGKIMVDSQGKESRLFNTKDGIAVKLANDLGYNVAIITGANNQGIKARLNRLGVKNIFLNSSDKVKDLLNYSKIKELSSIFKKPIPLLKDLLKSSKNRYPLFIEIKPAFSNSLLKKLTNKASNL